jgi:ribosome-associated protein
MSNLWHWYVQNNGQITCQRVDLITNSKSKALYIASLASDNKSYDIAVLDMHKISTFCDYFVICSCSSHRMVKSLIHEIKKDLAKIKIKPHHTEGESEADWALIDYGDVVVHIFYEETRSFYNLEWLWHDAKRLKVKAS